MTTQPTPEDIALLEQDRDEKRKKYEDMLADQFVRVDERHAAWVRWTVADYKARWANWKPEDHIVKP